jgi:anti-anti-sigma factor
MAKAKKEAKAKARGKAKSEAKSKLIKPGKGLSASEADKLSKRLLKLVEGGVKEIVIDFGKVERVDSVGLGVLIAAHNSLKHRGGKLRLKNVSERSANFFRLTHLDRHFEVKLH